MSRPVLVLWVDPDDKLVADGARLLEREGWFVDHAHNAVEALEFAASKSYDVVICELLLRDIMAVDLFDEIHQQYPNVKGIITTESASLHDLVSPLGPDLIAYLLKPIDIQEIVGLVAGALPAAAAPDFSTAARDELIAVSKEWQRFATPEPRAWSIKALYGSWQERLGLAAAARALAAWLEPLSTLFTPTVRARVPIMVGLVLVFLLLLGGGAAIASQQALPGDALYQVKMSVESAQVLLTPEGKDRSELYVALADKRMQEIETLVRYGRYDQVKDTAAAFEQDVLASLGELNEGALEGAGWTQALRSKLTADLNRSITRLAALQQSSPPDVSNRIGHAIALSRISVSAAETLVLATGIAGGVGKPPFFLTATQTPTQPGLSGTGGATATMPVPPTETLLPTETATSPYLPPLVATVTPTEEPTQTSTTEPEHQASPTFTLTPTKTRESRPPTRTPTSTPTVEPTQVPNATPTEKPGKGPKPTHTPRPKPREESGGSHEHGGEHLAYTAADVYSVEWVEQSSPLDNLGEFMRGLWSGFIHLVYNDDMPDRRL
ncbi:MAG: DUF5667 domain-containing protein [Rudaea sp.]